ncbi:3 CCCH RNA binding domain involved in RNA metabolism [Cryptosporidium bovis]|uniref:3 CCCH RNA binding domain involved in RNA metabolism n=1 Tax=Cryptosporidium bovis TaxID=310047 RepID=UPI00351A8350|nr:3 CCCH RNA binding domain involved in RNA metabolism [Cryptosporidium bovis]
MEQISTNNLKTLGTELKSRNIYNSASTKSIDNLSNLKFKTDTNFTCLKAEKGEFERNGIKTSKLLNKEELNSFRTLICNDHLNSKCLDPESCFFSHCSAWQRRNPSKYNYSPIICPNIDFLRKGNKGRMSLSCKCKKGRLCEFAHTKEEELYHPDSYKKKKCNSFPNCKRYYCPFIHEDEKPVVGENASANMEIKCETSSLNAENKYKGRDSFEQISSDISKGIIDSKKTNFDENKQELLLMLLNCQKLILEGDYCFAKKITENILSSISKIDEYEEFSNIISLNMWSGPIYYPNYLIKSNKKFKQYSQGIEYPGYFCFEDFNPADKH